MGVWLICFVSIQFVHRSSIIFYRWIFPIWKPFHWPIWKRFISIYYLRSYYYYCFCIDLTYFFTFLSLFHCRYRAQTIVWPLLTFEAYKLIRGKWFFSWKWKHENYRTLRYIDIWISFNELFHLRWMLS